MADSLDLLDFPPNVDHQTCASEIVQFEQRIQSTIEFAQEQYFEVGPTKWSCFATVLAQKTLSSISRKIELCATQTNNPKLWNDDVTAYIRFQVPNANRNGFYFEKTMIAKQDQWGTYVAKCSFHFCPNSYSQDFFLTDSKNPLVLITVATLQNVNKELVALQQDFKERFTDKFHDDIQRIRNNPTELKDSETTFISKDNKTFPANRIILSSRSPVFCKLLCEIMAEQQQPPQQNEVIIQVDDISAGALYIILEYCHTGILKEGWQHQGVLDGVVYGAHKYMLEELKLFLSQALKLVCTKAKCSELISLAEEIDRKYEENEEWMEYLKKRNVSVMESLDEISQEPASSL